MLSTPPTDSPGVTPANPGTAAHAARLVQVLATEPPAEAAATSRTLRVLRTDHATAARASGVAGMLFTTELRAIHRNAENAKTHQDRARVPDAHRPAPSPDKSARVAASATRLQWLLSADDAAARAAIEENARRHFEKARRARGARGGRQARRGDASPRRDLRAVWTKPTTSVALNAFLHEIGETTFAWTDIHARHEEKLVIRLFERARRQMLSLLLSLGATETCLAMLAFVRQITNKNAARMVMNAAAGLPRESELGAIARDYAPAWKAGDKQLENVALAAFAGRLFRYAERKRGPHVREDILRNLRRDLTEFG